MALPDRPRIDGGACDIERVIAVVKGEIGRIDVFVKDEIGRVIAFVKDEVEREATERKEQIERVITLIQSNWKMWTRGSRSSKKSNTRRLPD